MSVTYGHSNRYKIISILLFLALAGCLHLLLHLLDVANAHSFHGVVGSPIDGVVQREQNFKLKVSNTSYNRPVQLHSWIVATAFGNKLCTQIGQKGVGMCRFMSRDLVTHPRRL